MKFRIWDYALKSMETSPLWSVNAQGKLYFGNADFSDYKVELMIYTGCKDSEGTEIYEGDIVKSQYDDDYPLLVVKYNPDIAGYYPMSAPAFGGWEWDNRSAEECIVVGNIYEGVDGKPWQP